MNVTRFGFIEKLRLLYGPCLHPFVVRYVCNAAAPNNPADCVDEHGIARYYVGADIDICMVCRAVALSSGEQREVSLCRLGFWCEMVSECNSVVLYPPLSSVIELVRSPMILESLRELRKMARESNEVREDERIPFVKFCHEQAQLARRLEIPTRKPCRHWVTIGNRLEPLQDMGAE